VDLDLEKIVKIYRVAKTADAVLSQKAKLADVLSYQKKSMDTILGVADVAARAGKAELCGEDVRNTARAVWRHGPRVYAFVRKAMHKNRDKA
jgi:hypothetical protein